MEDRLKKKRIKDFIYGLLAYLLGAIIYDFIGTDNNTLRVLSGVAFGIMIRFLIDFYSNKKYPEIREKEKLLENDERLIIIRGKAAYFTLNIILFSLAIAWITTVIMKNNQLTYFVSGLLITIVLIMEISKSYWSKKI